MKSYVKPMMRAIEDDAGSCGCNFRFNETPRDCSVAVLPPTGGVGPCVTVDAGNVSINPQEINLAPIGTNTILGVRDGQIQVTPLENTGLPGTQPINFGIPVGTRGVFLDVRLSGSAANVDPASANVVVGGAPVLP